MVFDLEFFNIFCESDGNFEFDPSQSQANEFNLSKITPPLKRQFSLGKLLFLA